MVIHQDVIISLFQIVQEMFQLGQNIFSVGSNNWRGTSIVFSHDLVDTCVTFADAADAGRCFLWSRCPFDVISDSGR